MATLAAELEKAQRSLAEAKRLDTGGDEVSEAVRTAERAVETLSGAVQAAHRDAAAAGETAQAELEAARIKIYLIFVGCKIIISSNLILK